MIRAFIGALLVLAGLCAFPQEKPYVSVPNKSYRFISGIPKNRLVFLEDSNRIYKALRLLEKGWNLDTAFVNGWVDETSGKRQNFVSLWEDNGNEKQTSLRDTATFPAWMGSYWINDVLGRNMALLRDQGGVQQWGIKSATDTYESSAGGDAIDQENTYSSLAVNLNGDQRMVRLDATGFHNNGSPTSLGSSLFPWDTIYYNNFWPPLSIPPQQWDTTATAVYQTDTSKYTILGKLRSLPGIADSILRPDYNNGGQMAMQAIGECIFDTAYLSARIDSMLRIKDSTEYATPYWVSTQIPSYSATPPLGLAGTIFSIDTTKTVLFTDTADVGGKIGTKKNISDAVSAKVSSVGGTSPIYSSGGTTPVISINTDTLTAWWGKLTKGETAYSWFANNGGDLLNNNAEGLVTSISIRDDSGFNGNEDGIPDGVLGVYSGSPTLPQIHISNDNSASKPAWMEFYNFNSGEYFTDNTGQLGKIDFCGPAYNDGDPSWTKEVGASIKAVSAGQWRYPGAPPHKNSWRSADLVISTASGINLNEVARFTSTARMGIGTTNPGTALDVNGVITATGGNSTAWNKAGDSAKYPWYYSGGNTLQRGGGNVGIGTTNPLSALHLYGSAAPIFYADVLNANPSIVFRRDGTAPTTGTVLGRIGSTAHTGVSLLTANKATISMIASESWGAGANGTDITFSTTKNGATTLTEQMRLTNAGNVGINTTSPSVKFQIAGKKSAPFAVSTDNDGSLGDSSVYISSRGYVGIGNTSPTSPLTVTGNVASTGSFSASNGGALFNQSKLTTSADLLYKIGNESTGTSSALQIITKNTEAVRIDPSQRVGIGTTNPTAKLSVQGGNVQIGQSGSDSVSISSGSAVRLYNGATVFDDLMFPFSTASLGPAATCPTAVVDSGYYNFTVDTVAAGGVCKMYMIVQIPHRYKEGSNLYPHVHYKHTTAQGTPTFICRYRWFNAGAVPGAFTWIKMNTTTGTTNNTHQMVEHASASISGTGKTISSILQCEVYLESQTGTGGVDAYQFDLHYEIDAIGSNTKTSKN